ncbi:MAG: DUF1385 domain-containing protein [Clostridia bacterium]|nr:DUF1385 domain-containing protein [Clostridia bacterium]
MPKKDKESCTCSQQNPRLGRVGGQAVMEGVMMKNNKRVAVSVRRDDGRIVSKVEECTSIKDKHKFLGWPIIRGIVNFIEMLILSFRTLDESAELAGIIEEEETKFEKWLKEKFGKSVLDFIMGISLMLGFGLSILLFILLPNLIANACGKWFNAGEAVQSVISGISKMIIFVLYIYLVSLMKEIRRTFEYHGSEHKSIYCYEKGLELTVENVRVQSRFHPRCGTSFMFVMMLIGMAFAFAARSVITYGIGFVIDNVLLKTLFYTGISLIILLPLVTGVGYEFLRYAGKHDNVFVRVLSAPGLWMQRLTTREPTDDMIEVAIRSLKLSLPDEFPDTECDDGGDKPKQTEDNEADGDKA